MASKNKNDIIEDLLGKELTALDIFLTAKAQRTAVSLEEYIQSRLSFGVDINTIEQELLQDLNDNGRIFGEFRNAVRATVKGSTMRARDIAQYGETGVDLKFIWCAVLVNTCPDCLDRHGETKTWEEWESEGMPRTGHTVCKDNCKCMLIPGRFSVREPIQRGK